MTVAYVCLDDDTAALSTALALRQRVREAGIPIVVRMRHDAGLATLLSGLHGDDRGFDGLYAFGLLDRTCTPELVLGGTHEILALAIHDRYLQTQREAGVTVEQDPSLVPWEGLPEGLQESYRRKADHIGTKLKAVGCTVVHLTDWDAELFQFEADEIEIMAKMEQERRIEEHQREGWSLCSRQGPGSWDRSRPRCLGAAFRARKKVLYRCCSGSAHVPGPGRVPGPPRLVNSARPCGVVPIIEAR